MPSVDEVAVVIPGSGEEVTQEHRDIIVRLRGGHLQRISHLNLVYSSLHYHLENHPLVLSSN